MIELAIDASTYIGTTAVLRDGKVIAEADAAMRGRDVEALMPAVALTLTRGGVRPRDLERVICGAGPGSFTSLRIAASIAKGLAYGAGCPLFAVSSLALLVPGQLALGRCLAVLDALREEAYVAGFSIDGRGEMSVILTERIVRQADVTTVAESLGATCVGPGRTHDRAPHARGVAALQSLITAGGPVDLATWEPSYGRKAEAQARWEATHRRSLPLSGTQS